MTTRVLVLADTHGPRFWKRAPAGLIAPLRRAELILHAGDVCVPAVLDELAAYAPVQVVRGNNDGDEVADWGATETVELTVDGVAVAMIHDSGAKANRSGRLRSRFPGAELVIFGHSHIPWLTRENDLVIVNPGSPTDKRRQPRPTYGELIIDAGRLLSAEIVDL